MVRARLLIVRITIEPNRISILSYSGTDRSISRESLKEANMLTSRRYRNRTLGDFLKELVRPYGRQSHRNPYHTEEAQREWFA